MVSVGAEGGWAGREKQAQGLGWQEKVLCVLLERGTAFESRVGYGGDSCQEEDHSCCRRWQRVDGAGRMSWEGCSF